MDEGSESVSGGTHLLMSRLQLTAYGLAGIFLCGGEKVQKLFNADLLDIFPYENGFIYACKETVEEGKEAALFYYYDQKADVFEKIPVLRYINAKLGENGTDAARSIVDFVTCTVLSLSAGTKAAAYSDGTLKVFGSMGEIISENKVEYLNNPGVSPTVNGSDIWFAVPDSNAIINYSVKYNRIEFRVGSPKERAFCHPTDISVYDNKLFICNANSYKINTIGLDNYNMNDYYIFNEPVYKYFRVGEVEYAVMQTGIYSL